MLSASTLPVSISLTQTLSRVNILVDTTPGQALVKYEQLPHPVLIVTASTSSLYLQDLLELEPEGLIVTLSGSPDLAPAIQKIEAGFQIRELPKLQNYDLQRCERSVLRLLACGFENQRIAEELRISKRTVENRVTSLREKLNLQNRTELALFYLGVGLRP